MAENNITNPFSIIEEDDNPELGINALSDMIVGNYEADSAEQLIIRMTIGFIYYELPANEQTIYNVIMLVNSFENEIRKDKRISYTLFAHSKFSYLRSAYKDYISFDKKELLSAVDNIKKRLTALGYDCEGGWFFEAF